MEAHTAVESAALAAENEDNGDDEDVALDDADETRRANRPGSRASVSLIVVQVMNMVTLKRTLISEEVTAIKKAMGGEAADCDCVLERAQR